MKHIRQLILVIIGASFVVLPCAIAAPAQQKRQDNPRSGGVVRKIESKDAAAQIKNTLSALNFFIQKVSANVDVRPSGNYADIGFTTTEPTHALVEVSTKRFNDFPGITPAGQQPAPAFPPGAVTMSRNDMLGTKQTQHTFQMDGLGPNRTHYYVITTTGADGRTFRYWDEFRTLDSRRVKVVFEKINFTKKKLGTDATYPGGHLVSVTREGLQLYGGVNDQWGTPGTGYWRYPRDGSFANIGGMWVDTATYQPAGWEVVNIEAVVEKAPNQLLLKLLACDKRSQEKQGILIVPTYPADPRPLLYSLGPKDSGYKDFSNAIWATAIGQVDTTMEGTYQPGTGSFRISGMHGPEKHYLDSALAFEVMGRFEVSYRKPSLSLQDIHQSPDGFKQRKHLIIRDKP